MNASEAVDHDRRSRAYKQGGGRSFVNVRGGLASTTIEA
jgi:hypothetical protein